MHKIAKPLCMSQLSRHYTEQRTVNTREYVWWRSVIVRPKSAGGASEPVCEPLVFRHSVERTSNFNFWLLLGREYNRFTDQTTSWPLALADDRCVVFVSLSLVLCFIILNSLSVFFTEHRRRCADLFCFLIF